MNGFGMIVGTCVCCASFAASAASAVLPMAQAGDAAKVEAEARRAPAPAGSPDVSSGNPVRDGDPSSDRAAHLARQYALHRSSLYLYNPGRIGQLARAPGDVAVEQ